MSTNIKVASSGVGVGPFFLLFLTFLILKLTEVITWSWWWVTAPLWGPIVFVLGIVLFVFIAAGITLLMAGLFALVAKILIK